MDLAKVLASIGAPLLGAVLGGPPGLAAGAYRLVTEILGISSNSSVQDITKEIQANPEAAIRLRELELNYQQYLLSVRLQMDQAEYADRANARARELAITKATGTRDWFAAGLGVFVVLAFTVVLSLMIFRTPIPEERRDPASAATINILVGALTAGYSAVLGYYFGSSAGSKNKDGTIAQFVGRPELLPPFPATTDPVLPAPTGLIHTNPSTPVDRVPRETWRTHTNPSPSVDRVPRGTWRDE